MNDASDSGRKSVKVFASSENPIRVRECSGSRPEAVSDHIRSDRTRNDNSAGKRDETRREQTTTTGCVISAPFSRAPTTLPTEVSTRQDKNEIKALWSSLLSSVWRGAAVRMRARSRQVNSKLERSLAQSSHGVRSL